MNGEKCENVWAFDDLNFPANNCIDDWRKFQNWGNTHVIRNLCVCINDFQTFHYSLLPTLASCKVVQSCA